MIRTGSYGQETDYNSMAVRKQSEVASGQNVQQTKETVKSSETKLSGKAKAYLERLRKDNADFDLMVADADDDVKGLLKQSKKEFSVIFSSEELEKMASDEKYAQEKIHSVRTAVEMSERINEKYGFERGFGNNQTVVSKMAVAIHDDGGMSIFAELEKVSEKQQERIENMREKRTEDKKAEKNGKRDNLAVKRTVVRASSEEELLKKIQEVDWSKIIEEKDVQGRKIDFSV